LNEGPFLMHPVEAGTVGLYRQPVAILDFASLYPSLYRAYNLDYATLLHPDDVAKMPPEDVITTPAGLPASPKDHARDRFVAWM
jgi:DNA polymerase delta subunit 1